MGTRARRVRLLLVVGIGMLTLLVAGSATAGVENTAAAGQAAGCDYPRYIVHLQPRQRNPLYDAVQTFIAQHNPQQQNRAARYAPHVSVTGFFCTMSGIHTAIQAAIDHVGTPFGQPRVTAVSCNPGRAMGAAAESLITLHVDVPQSYYQFSSDVAERLHLVGPESKPVGHYHLTLFQADHPETFPLATFNQYCADARQAFSQSALNGYNSSHGNHPYWRIALYRADQPVSASYSLTNLREAWPINP